MRVGERKGEALLRHCLNLFELSLICIFLSWVLEVDLEIGSFEDGMFFSVKLGPHAKLVTVLNPEFPIGNGVSDDGGKNIQLKSTNNFIGTQPP